MPFKSEAQRRYLWANEPEIARDWSDTYGSRIQQSNGGLTAINRKGFAGGGRDSSTRAASKGSKISTRSYSPSEKASQEKTRITNQKISDSDRGKQQTANTQAAINRAQANDRKQSNVSWRNKHNLNARKKYIDRILKARMKKMQSGFMNSTIPGIDTMTMDELINLAPKIKAYGPDGTGLYSQKMIDDVLSKKRVPPEFFSKVNASGGLYTQGAAALANMIGPAMAGPVTQERLNELYKEYQDIQNIDPTSMDAMSVKKMMEIYEPNRYKTIYGDNQPDGDAYPQILPIDYNTGAGITDDVIDEKTIDYRFGTPNISGAADVTRGSYIFNQGGRVPRAFGGIMDSATGRRAYGLGSIFKSVTKPFKSVAKAAGKVLKSPVGMAAAGYFLGGGGIGSWKGWGGEGFNSPLAGLVKSGAKNLFMGGGKYGDDEWNPWKIGGVAMTALPLLGIGTEAKQDTMPGGGGRGGRLIDPLTGQEATPSEMRASIESAVEEAQGDPIKLASIDQKYNNMLNLVDNRPYKNYALYANGGRIRAEEGGLMNLGGLEKDYRAEGGFVPIGKEEKADDVPARLSVNEFVFTADAVRNAGGGDIDKGAEVMENVMKNLENGGRISEETQGNTGAQEMFSVSERIGEVI
jgi:hypothetical protein